MTASESSLAIIAALVLGIVIGALAQSRFVTHQMASRHCASRGYTDYKVGADWSIQCMTILPAKD